MVESLVIVHRLPNSEGIKKPIMVVQAGAGAVAARQLGKLGEHAEDTNKPVRKGENSYEKWYQVSGGKTRA